MKTSHMTATDHLNITKQMHIDGSSSVCSAKCKQMYPNFCKRKYCENININCVLGKGIPPGTGRSPQRSTLLARLPLAHLRSRGGAYR